MTRPCCFLFLAVVLLTGACGRRQPDRPTASVSSGHTVIFVGLDGADWQLLDEYVESGAMPNLARLVREGSSGVLETIRPPLSPLIWTSMMTGVSPIEHGILDFVQYDPKTGAKEPITSSLRRAPAIWNMATERGKRVAVLGLWATYPAEAINGTIVSDRLFTFLFKESAPPTGVVSPPDRDSWARGVLERARQEIDEAALKQYLPWLSDEEYRRYADSDDPYAHPVSALRRILIDTRVYDELGREVIARDRPDLTIVYFEGTDTIGHVFAPFAPPRQPHVSQADFERYGPAPERYFRQMDDRVGEYRRLAEESHAALMLASDHGFLWKEGRPTALSSNATTTAAKWHRNEGIYLLWGPGIAPSAGHAGRGSVQQVCATLLALLGLPQGRDVTGPPLPGVAAPAVQQRVDYFASYKPSAPPASAATASADRDTLANLKSLGYVGDGGPSASRSAGAVRTPGSYNNEGVILKEQGKTVPAMQAFEQALALDPNLASALWNLSDLLFARGSDLDRADDLLVRALANGLPEGSKFLIGRAIGYQRSGQTDRSLRLVNAALKVQPNDAELWLFRGRYRVDRRECSGAASDFEHAERLAPDNAASYASEGIAQMCAGNESAARRAFTRSLALDPNQPKVREFLQSLGKTP
jgi:Tfp pilus assembly protein PilF/predicted AlkP superfamily pyrophosphatase or phosphodiesterase